jgi:capsular exopolysaccharide synthesis family protein
MTLRQVIDTVWKRRGLAAITAGTVVIGTLMFVLFAPATYSAVTQIRFGAAVSSTASGGPGYGSIPLDLDAEDVTSPDVLKRAEAVLPGDSAAAVQSAVTASTNDEESSNKLQVTASGSSAKQAADRANAVAQAYISHLADQVKSGLADLRKQLGTQQRAETAALNALSKNASDRMAQQRFNQASARANALETQIASVESAGQPASVLRAAVAGTRAGLSPLSIMLLGLIAGIVVGAAVAVIRDIFDDRVRDEDDIEKVLDRPVLAAVAQASGKEFAVHRVPASTRVPTAFSESVRSLRTSLQFLFPDRHSVLALTSSEPGEGKSFLSANLAVAFAQAGRSVIVVEGDLRRPRLGTYFDIPTGAPGFADAVDNGASSRDIAASLVDSGIAGLRVLPAGRSTREPADLLASDELSPVFAHLRSLADIVLVDTPPALALADAALLGGECDGVVVVASIGRTRGASLAQTLQILRANRTNVIGAVANRSRRATVGSYAGYYTSAAKAGKPAEPAHSPELEPVTEPIEAEARPITDTPPGLFGDVRAANGATAIAAMSDDTVVRIPKIDIAAALAAQPTTAHRPGPRTGGGTLVGTPRTGRTRSGPSGTESGGKTSSGKTSTGRGPSVKGSAVKGSAVKGSAGKGSTAPGAAGKSREPRTEGQSRPAGPDRYAAASGLPTFLTEPILSTPDASLDDLDRHVLGASPTERPVSRRRRR